MIFHSYVSLPEGKSHQSTSSERPGTEPHQWSVHLVLRHPMQDLRDVTTHPEPRGDLLRACDLP